MIRSRPPAPHRLSAPRRRGRLARVLAASACATLVLTAGASAAQGAPGGGGRGCRPTLAPGAQTFSVQFEGTAYRVPLVVGERQGRGRQVPLVLDLHGSSANGVVQAGISRFGDIAAREGFIVANPSGAIPLAPQDPPAPDGSWAWNVPGVPTTAGAFPPAGARDDVAFLTAVIDQVDAAGCVDDDRVYATGYSGGGRMASTLACRLSDRIAAVAPVAGLRAGRPAPADTTVPEVQDCTPEDPVAVVTFHGDADPVNPYQGNGDLRWGYSAPVAVQSWARIDDCRVGPVRRTVSEHVAAFTYSGCAAGADVEFYSIAQGGHTWPGSTQGGPPEVTQEIDASELAWQFFADHPRQHARRG
ncbi:PHB depolymerase family esterase [Kineococcus siccus]|uniref:PHB depolymerase family esterase n=1 Tax=Kineococcus siccus TaxID=2696567 RepID=UPI00196B87C4